MPACDCGEGPNRGVCRSRQPDYKSEFPVPSLYAVFMQRVLSAEMEMLMRASMPSLQISYVSAKMGAHARSLAPDLAHLSRELGAWCEREAAARAQASAPAPKKAPHPHHQPRTPVTASGAARQAAGGAGAGAGVGYGMAATPMRGGGGNVHSAVAHTPSAAVAAAAAVKSSRKPMSAMARRHL